MREIACIAALALAIAPDLHAQRLQRAAHWPEPTARLSLRVDCPSTPAQRARRFAAATVGAWIGGMVAWKALDDPYGASRKVKGDEGYTPNANTAYAIGSWIGSASLGYLAAAPACRSLGQVLVATAVPSSLLLLGRDEPYLPLFGMVLVAPLQGAAAAVVR